MKPGSAVFVCSHVFNDSRPVLLVAKDGGDVMYLCGGAHGDEEPYQVVGAGHILSRDPTINDVMDLSEGWEAERSRVGAPWVRKLLTEDCGGG